MVGADRRGNQLFFASLCSFAWGEKELFLVAAASVMRRVSQVYLNACLEPRELICWYCLLCACVCVGLQLVCFKVKRSLSSLRSLMERTNTEHDLQLAMMNLILLTALNTKATYQFPPPPSPKVCPPHPPNLPPPPSPPKHLHHLPSHGLIPYPLLQEPLQIPPKRLRLQHRPPAQPLRHHRPSSRSPSTPLLNHTPTPSHLNRLLPNTPTPPPHNHNPQLQPPCPPAHIPSSDQHLLQTPRIRNRLLVQQQFNLLDWDPRLIGDGELDVQRRGRGEGERGEG